MDDAAAPPPSVSRPSGRSELGRQRPARRGYLVPGLIALAVLAALAVLIDVVGLQHHAPRTLAGPDVATLIAQDIQTRTPTRQPPQIHCPATEPVRVGLEFSCQVQTDSGPKPIAVTVTSAEGAFRWSEGAAAQGAG